ncbi:carboxyltransferase domain-containing protein, partial [Arthrobacter sp. Br18]|uniref:carboxyltransferase domain-containing protein n=1 Tax=Arthrobacter sp. Br18 TaxID=1312954 RepID=UPI000564B41B
MPEAQSPGRRILAVGDRAILVELPELPEVLSLQAQLTSERSPGQIDVVAAARTVLVTAESTAHARRIAARIRHLDITEAPALDDSVVSIAVQYDGADLAAVANLTGLSEEAVVTAHTAGTWTAAFGGFAPGFAYLTGGDHR